MSTAFRQLAVAFAALTLLFAFHTRAAAPKPEINFSRDILPVLSDNCFHCHGPDEKAREAKLRLDKQEDALRTKDPIIIPGKSAKSELVRRITTKDADDVMPPPKSNRKLTPAQIELLKRWVEEGAKWGKHWAYEVPQRPAVPPIRHSSFVIRNPIDNFIFARLEREGLKPSPEAPKETLIRRITLDLTGLPPTPEEVDAFLADKSPDAYERIVDRLLKSPRYGERMAWDWLDAARYADSNGFQGDPERTMWPWRDWVVNAFNVNQPYDQFTIEQLAADLLPNATREQKLASGFNRNNMHNGEGGRIPEETRVENVFDRVETTATIWLGVTFTCSRCHDHKFDPFTQRDYFGLYDIFNQMSETGQGRGGQAPPILDFSTPAEEDKVKVARQQLAKVVTEVEAFELKKFPRPEGRPLTESDAAKLPGNLPATLAKAEPAKRGVDAILEAIGYFETDGKDADYVKVLKKLLAAVRARDAAQNNITKVMIMDQLEKPRDTFILVKGAYDKATTNKVVAAMPASLVAANVRRLSSNSERGTRNAEKKSQSLVTSAATGERANRLDLARWLVSPENPLTARVTVNRYWQMFFGTGLVKTAEDFGVQGEKPSHPELLDWLAVEFMTPEKSTGGNGANRENSPLPPFAPVQSESGQGWNVKALVKLIVMSATYRQSSRVTPALVERDPENRLIARGPRYRMPSWMLRDVALAASGLLVDQRGGPSVKPYQPEGIWEEATFGKKTYKQDHGDALYRRSLYVFWRRIVGPTMFFDSAARQVCEVKQKRTNTPLHALSTLNDITYVEAARALAERVMLAAPKADARLEQAFRLVLARKPTAAEKKILLARLDALQQQFTADADAAQKLLTVGESKRNEKLARFCLGVSAIAALGKRFKLHTPTQRLARSCDGLA
ncbi:MAG: PSD1 domain-containing protein [Verrucomicrobia bacterium]|nr:PSD1 domain-containing protein [Verrucomicrobiota bacterium]